LLLPALALAAFGVSGAAASAAVPVRQTGVVLSVLSEKHALRLVEGPRVVDVPYHGSAPTGVAPGARITFTLPGKHATHITVAGHTDHVSVPGFVVRSGKLLELRLADGSTLALAKTSKLKVGQLAHVLVRFSANGTTVTPVQPTTPATGTKPTSPGTPTTPSTSHCANTACTFDLIGSVQSIDMAGDLMIIPVSGAASFAVAPGQVSTDDVYVGDFVHIVGTQSATTGTYTLTSLDEVVGCDNVSCTLTLDATVDEVDVGSIVVDDQNGDEYQISVTASQIAGPPMIQAGDAVHIVGTEDPTTGNYTATSIKDSGPAPGAGGGN
jgi:hypothetical protein